MTEINHAIGAEGIVSAECKEVISQYGDLIWNLLISGVRLSINFFFIYIKTRNFMSEILSLEILDVWNCML